jgi:hypothetical protein
MKRPRDEDSQERLEQFLDELDRKTHSNLRVTDPNTGIANLEVGPTANGYEYRLRDANGNTVYGNDAAAGKGLVGYKMAMPMYPSTPASGLTFGTTTTWVTTWQTRTFVNTLGVQLAYRYQDSSPSGGTSEYRYVYDIGSGPVVIGSTFRQAVNPTHTVVNAQFIWPSDLSDIEVSLSLQCRMASGSGSAVASPIWTLGYWRQA